jgi:hypothetical protein
LIWFVAKRNVVNRFFLMSLLFLTVPWLARGEETMPNPAQTNQTHGVLQGKVIIGPMHPGPVRVGDQSQKIDPKVFSSLKVVISRPDSKEKSREVNINGNGDYSVELDPGKYIVDVVPHKYGIHPKGQPLQEVVIETGKTTRFNLVIDTGIR